MFYDFLAECLILDEQCLVLDFFGLILAVQIELRLLWGGGLVHSPVLTILVASVLHVDLINRLDLVADVS